jgi:hypothetical protein
LELHFDLHGVDWVSGEGREVRGNAGKERLLEVDFEV